MSVHFIIPCILISAFKRQKQASKRISNKQSDTLFEVTGWRFNKKFCPPLLAITNSMEIKNYIGYNSN